MKIKKEIIAMILAGGQGSRLKNLTLDTPKPAVAFGGKYRIIDFVLSNCINSGIETVGLLVQYKPFPLTKYIGIGSAWDLDSDVVGMSVLFPHFKTTIGRWFEGTAHAIYENFNYIEQYDPEYVLVLSGDHIYKMDYSKMMDYHKENGADVTISTIKVPLNEANRFGILNTNKKMKVVEFEEKPKLPKSDLASMGVYVFTWKKLKQAFEDLINLKRSYNDFGHDVLPFMLENGSNIFAYEYKGYWKDVGTIKSLWEANMDIIKNYQELNLNDRSWIVYANNLNPAPSMISDYAKISNSSIANGCTIEGEVENSVIFAGVKIHRNAIVKNCVVMANSVVLENAAVFNTVVAENQTIPANKSFGDIKSEDIALYCKEATHA